MSEIHVKAGTLVNGLSIEGHKAMQRKIADLTMENDKLKERIEELENKQDPALPDWIAPGKWVEFETGIKHLKIKNVSNEYVYFTNQNYSTIEFVKSEGKPFTPQPCPCLPDGYYYDGGEMIGYKNDFSRPIDRWLLFLGSGSHEYERLEEIYNWQKKWGNV